MNNKEGKLKERNGRASPVLATPMFLRKLTRSGATRYLSVGAILPNEWQQVKVYVAELHADKCILVIEPIK